MWRSLFCPFAHRTGPGSQHREVLYHRQVPTQPSGLHRISASILLRVRRCLGQGFKGAFFERFYSAMPDDAWAYGRNAFHEERFRFIVDAIPADSLGRVLEVGCAEGHMTLHLARRVRSVVALDISEEAIRRARKQCAGMGNVECVRGDIRQAPPGGRFDAVICSDVLYYLSPRELRVVLRSMASAVRDGGSLVAAEFSLGAAKPPSRLDDVLRLCTQEPGWIRVSERVLGLWPNGDGVRMALFRRVAHSGGVGELSS